VRRSGPVDERLKRAIGSSKIQKQAGDLVRLALEALEHIRSLDESLYVRFVASQNATTSTTEEDHRRLWERTVQALPGLFDYCRSLGAPPPVQDEALGDDFDWDAPAPASSAEPSDELDLPMSAIGDLLAGMDSPVEDDTAKWASLREHLASIEYGLRTQYTECCERLEVALASGEPKAVLELLDDTATSTSEGVHAIIAAVYSTFVPEINAASIVPNYHSALGRALMVRRGLAELQTSLDPLNAMLQSAKSVDFALRTMRELLLEFVSSIVCRAMRAADRWQMTEFERELASQPRARAIQTSEGLAKYLDSLRSINQREVLQIHDRRAIAEMGESLASARQLLELSPKAAIDLVERAARAALRMRGRQSDMDAVLLHLDEVELSSLTAADVEPLIVQLETILAMA